jgi:hypothetical protein
MSGPTYLQFSYLRHHFDEFDLHVRLNTVNLKKIVKNFGGSQLKSMELRKMFLQFWATCGTCDLRTYLSMDVLKDELPSID